MIDSLQWKTWTIKEPKVLVFIESNCAESVWVTFQRYNETDELTAIKDINDDFWRRSYCKWFHEMHCQSGILLHRKNLLDSIFSTCFEEFAVDVLLHSVIIVNLRFSIENEKIIWNRIRDYLPTNSVQRAHERFQLNIFSSLHDNAWGAKSYRKGMGVGTTYQCAVFLCSVPLHPWMRGVNIFTRICATHHTRVALNSNAQNGNVLQTFLFRFSGGKFNGFPTFSIPVDVDFCQTYSTSICESVYIRLMLFLHSLCRKLFFALCTIKFTKRNKLHWKNIGDCVKLVDILTKRKWE